MVQEEELISPGLGPSSQVSPATYQVKWPRERVEGINRRCAGWKPAEDGGKGGVKRDKKAEAKKDSEGMGRTEGKGKGEGKQVKKKAKRPAESPLDQESLAGREPRPQEEQGSGSETEDDAPRRKASAGDEMFGMAVMPMDVDEEESVAGTLSLSALYYSRRGSSFTPPMPISRSAPRPPDLATRPLAGKALPHLPRHDPPRLAPLPSASPSAPTPPSFSRRARSRTSGCGCGRLGIAGHDLAWRTHELASRAALRGSRGACG